MATERFCPHCGKALPTNALGGICPECMLKAGLLQTEAGDAPADDKKIAPPRPEEIAPLFPQLELMECLGRGGMGAVYKARQPRLNRFVALKILVRERENDPKFTERFTREAQTLARLNHSNIVAVYDFGEVAGLCYLLMEFVDGMSLRQLMQTGKLSPDQALIIVPRICEALQFAHEQGVVHRDIKPENILLDKHGRVKIADFGIAKMVGSEGKRKNLTDERQVMGTPHYMAPEQIEKPQEVDHRADIYSLGVVFYEMLTGELPLGRFQPPSRKAQVDLRLDEVVLHALEKEPERRYQQVGEIKTDVEAITSTNWTVAAERSSDEPPKVPNLTFPFAAALTVLALLAIGIWLWLDLGNRKRAPGVPVITSFAPALGAPGTRVNIPGLNFDPAPSSNIVYFGSARAAVAQASPTNLLVTVPPGATFAPISETVNGLTAYSGVPFLATFPGHRPLGPASLGNSFNLAGGKGPFSLVIADLDGDGKPDLIFDNDYDATIWIYRNIGSNGNLSAASFGPPVMLHGAPAVGGTDNLFDLSVADLDGDGRLDIVVADTYNNVVSVFQNLCSPGILTPNSFGPRIDYPVGRRPVSVEVGDLDGDGKPEIIAANMGSGTLSILRNISTGGLLTSNSFAAAISLATPGNPSKVAARDVDGDGKVDLVTANYSTTNDAVSVFRNASTAGDIRFAPRVDLAAPVATEETVAVGDIDGDGKADLIVGSYLSTNFSVYRNIGAPGSITKGSFAAPVTFATAAAIQRGGIALGDIDGDGKPDVAIVGEYSSSVSLYRNLSTPGSFTSSSLASPVTFASGSNSVTVAIGDLDGDGRPDIAIANSFENNLTLWKNVATAAGANQQPSCTPAPPGLVAWWRGEENANDMIGGNNGVFYGRPSYVTGKVGLAFNFNGSSFVQVPDGPDLHFTNEMSVDAWFNLNLYTGTYTDILSKYAEASLRANSYALSIEGSPIHRAYFTVVGTNYVGYQVFSSTAIPTNQWIHIAGTYDGATARIYINGALSGALATRMGIYQGTQPLAIGCTLQSFPVSLFNGQIDEVTLYRRALNASEIAAIYKAGSAGKRLAGPPVQNGPLTEIGVKEQ